MANGWKPRTAFALLTGGEVLDLVRRGTLQFVRPAMIRPRYRFTRFLRLGCAVSFFGTLLLAALPLAEGAQPASNRRMAERLAHLDEKVDPVEIPFFADKAAAYYRAKIAAAQNAAPAEIAQLKLSYALSLLNAGQSEAALRELEDFEQLIARSRIVSSPEQEKKILEFKALCYLRMGEQENCLANHNGDSCLFPIRGGGVHQLPRGSRGAISVLTDVLDRYPSPYAAWLFNIAYMTLGEYPDSVPPRWLIPPAIFDSP
jgi:tetratricopeptide (TPR) repeat protein